MIRNQIVSISRPHSITSAGASSEHLQYRRGDESAATATDTLSATSTATVNPSCTGTSSVQGAITALGILCGLSILALVILAFYVSRYPRSWARHHTKHGSHQRRRRSDAKYVLERKKNISTAAVYGARKHRRRHDGRNGRYDEHGPSLNPDVMFMPAQLFGEFPGEAAHFPMNYTHDPSLMPGFMGQFVDPAFDEHDLMTDASDVEDNHAGQAQKVSDTDAEERLQRLKALELARQRAANR